jgi:membrane-bound ClpP family serine protease
MKRLVALLFLGATAVGPARAADAPGVAASTEPAPVYWMDFTGAVDPALARYADEGLAAAEADDAQAVVIALDVSGGSLDAAQAISRAVAACPVPVVAFVEPGDAVVDPVAMVILDAADVAAMVPGASLAADRRDAVDLLALDEDDLLVKLQDGSVSKGGVIRRLDTDGAPGVDWQMSRSLKALRFFGAARAEDLPVPPRTAAAVLTAGLLFALVAARSAWALRRVRPLTGREALEGRTAVMRSARQAFFEGQLWTVDGLGPFAPGEKVRVVGVEGNVLKVDKI